MDEAKKYFFGNEISEYCLKNGYVDYACLSKAFDAVLCNNMVNRLGNTLELESGSDYNEEDDYFYDIYQWYIIDDRGADILKEFTDEIVYYDSELEVYVWGVTHYGTSWSYVLTNIKIEDL